MLFRSDSPIAPPRNSARSVAIAASSLIWGMAITAVITYGILLFEGRGFRFMELMIGAMVAVIGLCYLVELFLAPVDWGMAALGIVTPQMPDRGALLISVGIVGATVMPHAVFLHSGLTQYRTVARDDRERKMLVRFSNREVVLALAVAGMVNMAMVMMAAAAFHLGHSEVAEIETAYHTLTPLLGAASAAVFLVSLIASGVSSSVVGTMAGQMIMQGFVNFRIPIWLRRAVTMVPAFIVVAVNANPTETLVMSQVVLSIALPVPMIALLHFTSSRKVMGDFANRRRVVVVATAATAIVLGLNFVLLAGVFGLAIPGF